MKQMIFIFVCALLAVALIIGCSNNNDQNSNLLLNGNSNPNVVDSYVGPPRLAITFFDKPAPDGIEHLYLNVVKIGIKKEDAKWIYKDVDTTIDFLELVNGVTVTLVDDTIPEGHYEQMRFVLGDQNTIVVDSMTYPLTIPSGQQTGVKLNFDFDISQNEFVRLYVDFDVYKSVVVANGEFKLKPSYRVFKEDISGTVAGMVTDDTGAPLANVMVDAQSVDYSTSTYTDSSGGYMFILPEGTYDVSAVADSGFVVDTSYSGVMLNAGDALTGFDFVISPEVVVTNGIISGMVTDTLGNPVIGTTVDIATEGYSGSAVTDSTGMYMFDVEAGTYDLSITPEEGFVVDTMYSGVVLAAGDTLTGLDFVISSEEPVVETGTISGSVSDMSESPINDIMVYAISGTDTTSTMTDTLGDYSFVLDPGTYDISAVDPGGLVADTSYTGVVLNAGDMLSGYDFVMQ